MDEGGSPEFSSNRQRTSRSGEILIGPILLIAVASQPSGDDLDNLHPAFIKPRAVFTSAWARGESEGSKRASVENRLKPLRRGIGSIRTSVLDSQTVSWIWHYPPELLAYIFAYNGKASYLSSEEIKQQREIAIPPQDVVVGGIMFYGYITLLPSFGAGYGQIDRYADPRELENVRVVLKVGDRIIQPVQQPGNLLQTKGTALNQVAIPRTTYATASSTATGSAYGPNGYVYATVTAQSTATTSYVEHREEDYNWYQGEFIVQFPTRDSAGKALIKKSDKEIEVIVLYGRNERKAKYKLSELENPLK